MPSLPQWQRLLKSNPDERWQETWQVMAGEWKQENGWLIGAERGNKGGIQPHIVHMGGKYAYNTLNTEAGKEYADKCGIKTRFAFYNVKFNSAPAL